MEDKFNTFSPAETEKIAYNLAEKMSKKSDKSMFICMYGDLGAGKTAFVRGFVSFFNQASRVKSPTYTIVNEYKGSDRPIYHFDLYRFEDDPESLYDIGFDEYVEKGHCIFEWSEYMPDGATPDDSISVTIEKNGETERTITITYGD